MKTVTRVADVKILPSSGLIKLQEWFGNIDLEVDQDVSRFVGSIGSTYHSRRIHLEVLEDTGTPLGILDAHRIQYRLDAHQTCALLRHFGSRRTGLLSLNPECKARHLILGYTMLNGSLHALFLRHLIKIDTPKIQLDAHPAKQRRKGIYSVIKFK